MYLFTLQSTGSEIFNRVTGSTEQYIFQTYPCNRRFMVYGSPRDVSTYTCTKHTYLDIGWDKPLLLHPSLPPLCIYYTWYTEDLLTHTLPGLECWITTYDRPYLGTLISGSVRGSQGVRRRRGMLHLQLPLSLSLYTYVHSLIPIHTHTERNII